MGLKNIFDFYRSQKEMRNDVEYYKNEMQNFNDFVLNYDENKVRTFKKKYKITIFLKFLSHNY
jgi:hypothetical protein